MFGMPLAGAPAYDRLPERWWLFVPLWGIVTGFPYTPRRVECPEHGVVVEHIPWSEGTRPITTATMGFLARWARHLSWRQTVRAFQSCWEAVYRSVEWFVQWGLARRTPAGIEAIGIDEIHWGKGKRAANFLTVDLPDRQPLPPPVVGGPPPHAGDVAPRPDNAAAGGG